VEVVAEQVVVGVIMEFRSEMDLPRQCAQEVSVVAEVLSLESPDAITGGEQADAV
jgi:hypothetical protein